MPLREANYWLDTVDMPVADWERALPARCEVAVIGAGFTGLAAARELARRGARVVVLEAESIGWGASSRNGGMVLTGLKVGAEALVQRYGRDLTKRLFAASLAAIEAVEQIVAEEQIACNFARVGHLEVAAKPAHYAGFQRSAEAMEREFGHRSRLIAKGDLGAEVGSSRYYGGLVDEMSAGVNPARYVAGLARAAERAGAQLFEGAHVRRLERAGTGYRLTTGRGPLEAAQVLVATGGYTGRAMQPLARPLTRRIVPIGSYIIATAPLAATVARSLIPNGRMVFDSKNFLAYYRLTPDQRMLFGGRARFLPESPATVLQSAAMLRRAMVHVFPQLAEAEVDYAWGGTLDFAFDQMPHAGRQDGAWYALGYAGHGVALATYLGTLAGQAMAGETRDNPFADIPFPDAPLGLYDGRPWFLPFAGAYYRLLDVIS